MSPLLRGRLGLDTARIPHADRHGLLLLSRGGLSVRDGTLHFVAAKGPELDAGDYDIPVQSISCILLGPGGTVSHDALRLLVNYGTGLLAVGEGGVRLYASMPFGPDDSTLARRQATLWGDVVERDRVARHMYEWRFGESLPSTDIAVLRGVEGARMKELYKVLAQKHGVSWRGRRYDRAQPTDADPPNQAINHTATAVQAAAMVAVAVTGTIPQLGFIHEESGRAFVLDIADLYRTTITLPIAFKAVRMVREHPELSVDRAVRQLAREHFSGGKLIPTMIDRIKELFHDHRGDP